MAQIPVKRVAENASRTRSYTATVIAVLGPYLKVRLQTGAVLDRITYQGQTPAVDDTVTVTYTDGTPIAKI